MRKPIRQPKATGKGKAAAPPKPESWLDGLAPDDRRRAQRMVRTIEKEGLDDAESMARAHLEGGATSRGLPKRILEAVGHDDVAGADDAGRKLVADALAVVTGGTRIGPDIPGWALVETDPRGAPTDRLVDLD